MKVICCVDRVVVFGDPLIWCPECSFLWLGIVVRLLLLFNKQILLLARIEKLLGLLWVTGIVAVEQVCVVVVLG